MQHVAHRRSDETAQLNHRIAELKSRLAGAQAALKDIEAAASFASDGRACVYIIRRARTALQDIAPSERDEG